VTSRPRIHVSAEYAATPEQVWQTLESIESHVDWMSDAESIHFTTDQTRGVGTAFDCVTRVGPIRVTDRLEITEWEPARTMGVRHIGVVTGTGRFTLAAVDGGRRTRVTWQEELRFPWWLGGRLGARIGGRSVLRRIWAGNLRRLRSLVEGRR
jgi:carbon monoxide dehydrogenase subunit G